MSLELAPGIMQRRIANADKGVRHVFIRDFMVKCRIGVDDQNPEQSLPEFLNHISGSGRTGLGKSSTK